MKKILSIIAFFTALNSFGISNNDQTVFFNENTQNRAVLVLRVEAKEMKTEKFVKLITKMVKKARKQSGNLCYNVYQDIDAPTKFIIYGVWKNEEAFKMHNQTEYAKKFETKIAKFIKTESTSQMFERSEAPMPKSSQNALVLFASIDAIDGKEVALQTMLEELIPLTMAEEGVEHYELHKLKGTDNKFMYHETWTTLEHWNAHMKTKHLVGFLEVKDNYVDGEIEISRTKQIL